MIAKRMDSRGKELFCGEYERDDGRYEYRYRSRKGQNMSIYARSLAELRHEESRIMYLEHLNISKQISQITLNDQYDIWISGKQNIRENTRVSYQYLYNAYIRNSLGKKLIDEISTFDISDWAEGDFS